jgi:peptide/nickel transport system permease protein
MRSLRRFFSLGGNWLGAVLVLVFVVVAVLAPALAARPAAQSGPPPRLPQPPSAEYPLGRVGNSDVWYVLVWGTRDALRLGVGVTLLTGLIGVTLGAASGYAGGWLNAVAMRLADAFLAFPALAAVWLINYIRLGDALYGLGQINQLMFAVQLTPAMLALILFSWMPYARLINTNVIRLKGQAYVEAARALGAGPGRILLRHLLPNAIAPVIVLAARDVGGMVIWATAFAFVSGGGSSMWGGLLLDARDFVMGTGGNPLRYWWVYLPVTLALVLFGLAWNLLGDGLNQALNPRQQR